ncbi:polysaccharide deacetylase family protein [Pseudoteredinibacter isoporae]|uniref:Peptidoglycan/xylan/chitin deacetylase (PgdA/CDA1 family) n=1 Tax=Pseudoteredinibacter isoporae TaxID=570281 RepID=A0A7X0MW05_9GAMM|nr:polysaccharide deacetylase family protein [Pseudoteredinibacter isoporae]MBB6521685.1 peptidoglycan/xylan/chitin deacetylase (PgdA/CDA1 family) [Pseudoteredinibacter isoporae]NHO87233.1 polysaccharide deacetylase family protein [Pseudoteredinibacter isoporae]NIB23135.1 polysaccharide deacetylase family protein [Pseudoteredinibacter isoporae]
MLAKFGKVLLISFCVFLAAFEYRTAVLEFVWPAQWGGNTYWHGQPHSLRQEKQIAITFDDGPSLYTAPILDILKEHQITATFFMMGRQVEAHPELARRVVREGHEIGNHGYDLIAQSGLKKYYLSSLSDTELQKAENRIREITGQTAVYFRPPGGQIGRNLWKQVEQTRLTTITGTLPFPEASNSAEQQLATIVQHLEPGGILILHDGDDAHPDSERGQNVLELMPLLLKHLQKEGYKVVPLNVLLTTHNQ